MQQPSLDVRIRRGVGVRAVIFDIDGTLVDSNDAHAGAWVTALGEAGFRIEPSRVRQLIGKGGDKLLPQLTGLPKDSPDGERISRRRAEIFRTRYVPHLRPFRGARPLVQLLRDRGYELGIATSATPDELDPLLRIAEVDDLIPHRTSSGDADNSKPDPDIVQAALERLGCDPEDAVMIGDTPYDVEAAGRARVATIALRTGGWADDDLAGAIAIYDDPEDLRAHYEHSPLARTTTRVGPG
jgi:HAD superfamily hydrolase (TIGR01509 family)